MWMEKKDGKHGKMARKDRWKVRMDEECGCPAQAVRLAPFPPAPEQSKSTSVLSQYCSYLLFLILCGLSLLRNDQKGDTADQDQGIGGEPCNITSR